MGQIQRPAFGSKPYRTGTGGELLSARAPALRRSEFESPQLLRHRIARQFPGSASVTVNAAMAVGGINATSGLVDNMNISGAASVPNPYAALTVPATSSWGSPQSDSGASTVTLNPGCKIATTAYM